MIDKSCSNYVGDEDCHKCLEKGLLFDCSNCEFQCSSEWFYEEEGDEK